MIVPEADQAAIARAARARDLDLEEVREAERGGTASVTVVVDGDGGVPLDTLAGLSGDLDAMAETWGRPEQPVLLEVTSRGVDAPLTEPRHWRRARGRSVELVYTDGADGPARARVGDVDPDGRTVRLVSRRGRAPVAETVSLDDVTRAVVRVEFGSVPGDELELLSGATDVATGGDDTAGRKEE